MFCFLTAYAVCYNEQQIICKNHRCF